MKPKLFCPMTLVGRSRCASALLIFPQVRGLSGPTKQKRRHLRWCRLKRTTL